MEYFKGVFEWLKTAGVTSVELNNENPESTEKFELLKELIMEEFKELQVAFDTNDTDEFVDALIDIIWMTLNGVIFFGLTKLFLSKAGKVMKSNFTKFTMNKTIAEETVHLYRLGTHPHGKNKSYETTYKKVGKYYVITLNEGEKKSKIMKSIMYKSPNEV